MNKLDKIKNKINDLQTEKMQEVIALENEAFKVFEKLMIKNKNFFKVILADLNKSRQLVDDGEYYSIFIHVDFSDLIDVKDSFQVSLLERYFSEYHGLTIDLKNGCLMNNIGPAILINDEGDVLDQDSGKWIISKTDYEDETDLKSQIEAYMEKSGYFPSVLKCDRYGNAFFVNTSKKD